MYLYINNVSLAYKVQCLNAVLNKFLNKIKIEYNENDALSYASIKLL